MASLEGKITIKVDSKESVKRIERATKAAEKLQIALDKLQDLEIGIDVVSIKKKWWKFWSN